MSPRRETFSEEPTNAELQRQLSTISTTLKDMNTKLETLLCTQSAHEERIKNVEKQSWAIWGALGAAILSLVGIVGSWIEK
jgi:hypothetical protein